MRQIRRVERQRAERQRRELERHRQEREEAARREAEAEAEAYRRKVAAERAFYAEILRKRERDEHEKVMEECYRVCFRTALKALWAAGMPTGPDWTEHPKAQQLRRDFPRERPSWWAPPAGLYEAVKADQALRLKFPYQEPDWGRWVPSYVPGRAWPWRQPAPVDADVVDD